MIKDKIVILIITCIVFYGCRRDRASIEVEKVVKEWTGKEIIFPENIPCKSIDKDTICISPNNTPYKILVYTDSTGCTNCKLHLYKWNTIIEQVNNEMADLISFQFYFHPKNIEEIFFLFRRDSFKYPSYIDVDNQLNKLNNLPKDSKFQTFLLDKYNKVVCIGNPAENIQIWNLYKQIIKGNKKVKQLDLPYEYPITSLAVDNTILELKNLKINETTTARFILKNIGNNPLVVTNVNSTCGCTVPEWTMQPVLPKESTEIIVQVTPGEKGFFRKTITVYCNVEKRYITLIVQGEVDDTE